MNNFPLLIPAAGHGSRLFPATWGIPKELFPLGNKPAIHFLLEEAIKANINNIICVTSSRKEALFKYLNYRKGESDPFLNLEESKKLECLNDLNKNFEYNFAFQEKALGVGNAILKAEKRLMNEDFFCMAYPDDVINESENGIKKLVDLNKKYNCSIIALEKVPLDKISSYGVILPNVELENGTFEISNIIEKPKPSFAPSEYAVIGRYILSKDLIKFLKKDNPNSCFITAINNYLKAGNKIIGTELKTSRYDIGTVFGWINAINSINKTEINL